MPPSLRYGASGGAAAPARSASGAEIASRVSPLTDEHRDEALTFLAERPLHTVVMAGFIRDNGVQSPLNRGTFHACRNAAGQLEGLALIGHATLFEARTEAALKVFAGLARQSRGVHVIMGEQEKLRRFWRHYGGIGRPPRLLCRELLFERRWPVGVLEEVPGLRRATTDDLAHVVPVQAQMAFEESGVNPLETDASGFRSRCARRIKQGRVWVWIEGGRLIFKADVISETPEANYIEGVYVHPTQRGRGYGLRCFSQLGRTLLTQTHSLCLLVNERNTRAQAFYRRCGYKFRDYYDTLYL